MKTRFYAINELPKNKWLRIIGSYEAANQEKIYWYYEIEDK